MDALDHLAGPGLELLDRVDDLLVRAGAPDDHAIWPLLRRVRALPGEAAAAVVALSRGPLDVAARDVRLLVRGYDEVRGALSTPVAWEGAAGDAFATHRAGLADGVVAAGDDLAAIAATADEVAEWIDRSRRGLAAVLGEVIASAEAVEVVSGSTGAASAAATIGACVLAAVDTVIDDGDAIPRRAAPAGAARATRAAAGSPGYDRTTRVRF